MTQQKKIYCYWNVTKISQNAIIVAELAKIIRKNDKKVNRMVVFWQRSCADVYFL